jgi:hypothetical protein
MFKVTKDPETGRITSLHLQDVTFSYSYLVSPRPETDFNPGTYGTELIIKDSETLKAVKQYLNEIMEEAKVTTWEGKTPKQLNLPLKKGNEESELEADAFVLKTSSKTQPKLFIRTDDSDRAHEVTESELDEIYAGMTGDAIVKFRAYAYNGIKGIKAYLNAVCKTGNGTPLAAKTSYEDVFSGPTDFDAPAARAQTVKPKVQPKTVAEDDINLDALLSGQGATTGKAEVANLTIDDLLNS